MSTRNETDGEVPLAALELSHLALFVGYRLSDEVQRRIARAGFDDVRFSHGFVFQHLVPGPRRVSELAERLEVTSQAVSKVVRELTELGYVFVEADPEDARARRVALTKRGRAVVEAGRRARREVRRELARKLGEARVSAAEALLREVLEATGGVDAIRERRVRAPS